jgi:hypothetical protein
MSEDVVEVYVDFIMNNILEFIRICFNPLLYEEQSKIKELEDIELELFWKKNNEKIVLKYENDDYMFVVTNMSSILLEAINVDIRHYYEGNFNLNKYQIQEMNLIINNYNYRKENSKYEIFNIIVSYLSLITSNNITDMFQSIINNYDPDFIENNCCINIKDENELNNSEELEQEQEIKKNNISHSKNKSLYDDEDFILV